MKRLWRWDKARKAREKVWSAQFRAMSEKKGKKVNPVRDFYFLSLVSRQCSSNSILSNVGSFSFFFHFFSLHIVSSLRSRNFLERGSRSRRRQSSVDGGGSMLLRQLVQGERIAGRNVRLHPRRVPRGNDEFFLPSDVASA